MDPHESVTAAGAVSTPDERFTEIVLALMGEPGVTPPTAGTVTGRGFGSNALKVRGRIFAFVSGGRLVVKLPRSRVEALCASGGGQRWDPGHGRLMKEWLKLASTSNEHWLDLAREALAYVGRVGGDLT